ncbi:CST complex subunit TEN1 isoform X2 [Sinocyclocheilus rhinocerous]|uniref:CST complex subunit TEN1 isoform X2 n=1 Tax=Sinocyclocheilus rhinocerous TaxID=307959 RepID=UPI0007BABA79|nr:PREDICTED: CST complex subunit TEN1 isoform X2 [Sinocyclocheilus rhinocerous]
MVLQCERMAVFIAKSFPFVVVILISYKPEGSKAVLSGQQSSAQCHVSVQTTLVEPFQPTLGAQYFVLGEIEKTDGLTGVILHARALSNVDGVDLTLMQKAIREQRCFFKKRIPEINEQAPHCEPSYVKNL